MKLNSIELAVITVYFRKFRWNQTNAPIIIHVQGGGGGGGDGEEKRLMLNEFASIKHLITSGESSLMKYII